MEVNQEYKAKGDCFWFYVNQEYKADVKIYWVNQEHKADIKVCKVSQEHKAKWQKPNQWQNRLFK